MPKSVTFKIFNGAKIDLSKFPVLPREETEFWVKKVLKGLRTFSLRSKNLDFSLRSELKKEKKKLKILDLFSGTGCIGIAILKNIKNSLVDFGDIDNGALEQIEINLKLNKINPKRTRIIKTDIFSKIQGKYDLILANPPYVAKERLNEVQFLVKENEPKMAWYGGKRGMVYILKFLKEAKNFLKKYGKIYFEFDPLQRKEIEIILKKGNYKFYLIKRPIWEIEILENMAKKLINW